MGLILYVINVRSSNGCVGHRRDSLATNICLKMFVDI